MELKLKVHGRGNAWPVLLGEDHPFYDREDYRDLSNAAYSLRTLEGAEITGDVLIDAGHGTIQSLITGENRIPDCICLTHGHMDHTLSVDWVVQSFWRKHRRERLYPLYATFPVYEFLVRTCPHLESLLDFRCLEFGRTLELEEAPHISLTAYPVFHGPSGVGASMLLFESRKRKVLFSGDLLTPLLRKDDYSRLGQPDLLVVDGNNRFPWPRTNHWSFAGSREDARTRSDVLQAFIRDYGPREFIKVHYGKEEDTGTAVFLDIVREEWDPDFQPYTVLEFLGKINPAVTALVHYSGTEDKLYQSEDQLDASNLRGWAEELTEGTGIGGRVVVPEAGEEIII